jgi:hypothetical protein
MITGLTSRNVKKINKAIVVYLKQLHHLMAIVFSFYIKRDYFENRIVYEKKLVRQTKLVLSALQKIRDKLLGSNNEDFVFCLENLYEIIFSLDLLKHRLLDHATFEVCENELKNIFDSICVLLNASSVDIKKINQADADLRGAILAVEAVFQNTVQFLMADPMMFLFFIRDLQSLNNEIKDLHLSLLRVFHEA